MYCRQFNQLIVQSIAILWSRITATPGGPIYCRSERSTEFWELYEPNTWHAYGRYWCSEWGCP